MPDGTRVCNTCAVTKPIAEFGKHPECKGGRNPKCRSCTTDVGRKVRACEVCGVTYTSSRRNGRVCPDYSCRWFIDPRAKMSCDIPWHPCDVCGSTFINRGGRKKRCGDACVRLAAARRGAAEPRVIPCVACGETITAAGPQRFCPSCRDARRKKQRQEYRATRRARGRRRDRNHRDRARKYGAIYEPINAKDIFERDGWKCQLCGGKILKSKSAPHPKSASLDHIVPLASGGDHVTENVQAAHFLCNSIKGDRLWGGGEQLLLIG